MVLVKAVASTMIIAGCLAATPLHARQAAQWDSLTPAEKDAWANGISLLMADQFPAPGDDFRFYTQLDKHLPGKPELSTTETTRLQNSIALEAALKLKQNQIRKSVEPTDNDLKQWFETRKASYSTTESVNLHSIFIRKFDPETSDTAKQRARHALDRINKGEPFGRVAYEMSDARSAVLYGSAGTIHHGKISPELENIVFSAPLNKVIGPVETARGYYLLKVTGKNTPFTLDNPKDRDKARQDFIRLKTYEAMAELETAWRNTRKPEVIEQPADLENWLNQPWIQYDNDKTVPFYHLYFQLSNHNLTAPPPGQWNSYYQEEATIASSNVIQALAAYESLSQETPLDKVAELAVPAHITAEKLRQWYATLNPSQSELESFYETQKDTLPEVVLHDFVTWSTPVDLTTTSGEPLDNEAFAERFTETLNRVHSFIATEKTETRDDVERLFAKMRREFPQSRVTSDTATQSISPLIDPILSRTDVNELSRPFDAGNYVAVIYMLGKKNTRPTLQQMKDSLVDGWRQAQLNELFLKVKAEAGIKK